MAMETDPNTSPSPDDAKACADCHTTKTPLWRGGPDGPKSLCNACGIRYRKRRRQALGLPADPQQPKKKAAADPQQQDQPPLQPRRKAVPTAGAQQQGNAKAASNNKKKIKEDENKKSKEENGKKKKKKKKNQQQQVTLELRVVGFGKEVMLKQRGRVRRSKCMSEEERAAVLLMALSSGVIYA